MKRRDNPALRAVAQELRKGMTPEERHLWYDFLKTLPMTVNRQKVIGRYIADFYCAKAKLIIELDGAHHYTPNGKAYDRERDAFFNSLDIEVVRYPNSRITQDFEKVCEDIRNRIAQRTAK